MTRELAIGAVFARVVLVFALASVVSLAAAAVSPSVANASTSPVEDLISQCPSSAQVASLNADLTIAFEVDPTAGALLCHASARSADLTRLQKHVYQALRVMKAIDFPRLLPWTSQNLYDWFVASIDGIRFRDDILLSFCCEPAKVIDVLVTGSA